jgi:hypothetical protein
MKMIWFKTRKSNRTEIAIRKILKGWQLSIKEYQRETDDLGYGWYYTEKSNFGFFLRACAKLGMHFLPEFTMERRRGRQQTALGRPDCWIWLKEGLDAYFEIKKAYNSIDGKPRKSVMDSLMKAVKQLNSLRDLEKTSYRVALCFITLGRKEEGKRHLPAYDKVLSVYLDRLRIAGKIDFYGAYLSDERTIRKAYLRDKRYYKDTYSYPSLVVIGKYWRT